MLQNNNYFFNQTLVFILINNKDLQNWIQDKFTLLNTHTLIIYD